MKTKTLALKINRCKKRPRNGKRFGYTIDCNCSCHNIHVLQRRNKPIGVSFPSSLNVRQLYKSTTWFPSHVAAQCKTRLMTFPLSK